ncbi:MAG TPA: Rrf2 family transcriptional regulator [Chitinophagaceae bacterium]
MVFSKSFGYALRGILYIAIMNGEKQKVQIDEIAEKLSIPRHFLGKVMQELVKNNILSSTKGPYGGFSLNENSLKISLIALVKITDGLELFESCVLRLKKCNSINPCPLHKQIEHYKTELLQLFSDTSVNDLLKKDKLGFIKSIATI